MVSPGRAGARGTARQRGSRPVEISGARGETSRARSGSGGRRRGEGRGGTTGTGGRAGGAGEEWGERPRGVDAVY